MNLSQAVLKEIATYAFFFASELDYSTGHFRNKFDTLYELLTAAQQADPTVSDADLRDMLEKDYQASLLIQDSDDDIA